MFRHIALAVFMVAVFLASERATAQDYPEYDGIYLRLKSGEFVELPYSPRGGAHQLVFQASGKFQSQLNYDGLEGEMTYFSIEDFSASPVVDVSQIVSIVVIGPPPRQLGFHPMVDARSKNAEYVNDPTGVVEHRVNGSSSTIPARDVPDLITRQRCALQSENLRIKRVSNFVTEYEPKQGVKWIEKVVTPENRTCKRFAHYAKVIEIILDGQVFANFITAAGRSEFSSTAGGSSPAGASAGPSRELDGVYNELGLCSDTEDSEGHLRVAGDVLEFYSSTCKVNSRKELWGGQHQLVLNCAWSEGGEDIRFVNARKYSSGDLLWSEKGTTRIFSSCS
jgi:hypothetical protein